MKNCFDIIVLNTFITFIYFILYLSPYFCLDMLCNRDHLSNILSTQALKE